MYINPYKVVIALRQAESIVFTNRSVLNYPVAKRSEQLTLNFDRLSHEPLASLRKGARTYVTSKKRKKQPWEERQRQFLVFMPAQRVAVPLSANDLKAWQMGASCRAEAFWPWKRDANGKLRYSELSWVVLPTIWPDTLADFLDKTRRSF